jgi:hypothetical protein
MESANLSCFAFVFNHSSKTWTPLAIDKIVSSTPPVTSRHEHPKMDKSRRNLLSRPAVSAVQVPQ